MKLCLPSGSSSQKEAEMNTYNADPMHAGKNMVIEAGTNAGEAQVTESQLILSGGLWGRLREMHGFLKSVVGGTDSQRAGHLSRLSLCLHCSLAPGPPLCLSNTSCVTQGICTGCVLGPE